MSACELFFADGISRGGSRFGLKADGSVVAWGRYDYGLPNVPAPNSGFVAVAAGDCHSLGLKANGSIVAGPPRLSDMTLGRTRKG